MTLDTVLAYVDQGIAAVLALFPLLKAFAPTGFYLAVLLVLAIDLIDAVLFKRDPVNKGRWPNAGQYLRLVYNDVADRALLSVLGVTAIAFYAATGDKVAAAQAVCVAGVLGSLALEKQYFKTKLYLLLSGTPAEGFASSIGLVP